MNEKIEFIQCPECGMTATYYPASDCIDCDNCNIDRRFKFGMWKPKLLRKIEDVRVHF